MEARSSPAFANDNRPYEVTASAATAGRRKPNFVELKDLRARIATDDKGGVARLEAAIGMLDTQKEQMNLRTGRPGQDRHGPGGQLRSAFVDFKAGTVVSNEPVTVTLAQRRDRAAEGLDVDRQRQGACASWAGSAPCSKAPQPAAAGCRQRRPIGDPRRRACRLNRRVSVHDRGSPARRPGRERPRGSGRAQYPAKPPAAAAAGGKERAAALRQFRLQQGADQDRRGPARRLRQGRPRGVHRQRGGGPGRQHHEMHDS